MWPWRVSRRNFRGFISLTPQVTQLLPHVDVPVPAALHFRNVLFFFTLVFITIGLADNEAGARGVGGLQGCSGLHGRGLIGRHGEGFGMLVQEIIVMVFWPLAILGSTLYALSHTVPITCVVSLSFIVPFFMIGFAIYTGSLFVLVLSVVLTLALGALWAFSGRREQPETVSSDEEDEVLESSEQVAQSHPYRLAPVCLSVTFLLLCAWTYGMTPVKIPTVNVSRAVNVTSTTTTTTVIGIPGSNWWLVCGIIRGQHMYDCLEAAFCCCTTGYMWNGVSLRCEGEQK